MDTTFKTKVLVASVSAFWCSDDNTKLEVEPNARAKFGLCNAQKLRLSLMQRQRYE
ncbi:hypothetical protein AAHH88_00365 [Candidatus Hodgkinia cicadicola]